MAKKKEFSTITAFKLFFEGVVLYFKNIGKFLKYMLFPVFGQIIGIILIFGVVHLFASHIDGLISINPALNNVSAMFLILIVASIPGFVLFFTSFWKYLVAMGALNSMANNLISKAKLEDLEIHNDTVTRRSGTFVGLLLILSVISLVGLFPLFLVPFLIVMIYLCLIFQVFALEENLNAFEIVGKSFKMIKGNFGKALILLILLYLFTYEMLPKIFNFAFESLNIYEYLVVPVSAFSKNLPLEEISATVNTILAAVNNNASFNIDTHAFSKTIISQTVAFTIIGLTLPLRSICCTLLYKNLETKRLKEKKIKEL